jgi:hypothetical protein
MWRWRQMAAVSLKGGGEMASAAAGGVSASNLRNQCGHLAWLIGVAAGHLINRLAWRRP